MNVKPADRNTAERGWRLVGEFSQPPGVQDEHWVVVGLMGALEGIEGLSPDLERVTHAAVAAVKRAGGYRTPGACLDQPLIVRVFVSVPVEEGTASPGWGFFVLERAAGGGAGTEAEASYEERQIGRCIELYLYTDSGWS